MPYLIAYKLTFFKTIQNLLLCQLYFIHLDPECQIFIDLNISKKFKFRAIIYHLKRNLATREYPIKKIVELILFLNQLFNPTKTQYWPIELELIGIV